MSKRKILVVDDEVDFVDIMKARLLTKGYEVITANNGKAALERVKKDSPDAVILDVMMPGMDGLSVLKEIRAHDQALPVFITTAFSNEERIRLAGTLNASGFIIKSQQDMAVEIDNITMIIDVAEKFKGKSG